MSYICPVCNYPNLQERPRGETTGGSYEICPSCGFQFGVTDEDLGFTYEVWRQDWITKGMPWNGIGIESPDGWNPDEQLKGLAIVVKR